MFRRNSANDQADITPIERVTSVLGSGIIWHGSITGRGGVRIEGTFEGEINLNGLLVVGESGRVTCENVQANTVIVAGAIKGNITAEKLEIRSSGHVWGDVTIVAFSTEEGAFLRGNITMEEQVNFHFNETPEENTPPDKPLSE
jgi:cytoskeletal protein CcmA (bactofilin family)